MHYQFTPYSIALPTLNHRLIVLHDATKHKAFVVGTIGGESYSMLGRAVRRDTILALQRDKQFTLLPNRETLTAKGIFPIHFDASRLRANAFHGAAKAIDIDSGTSPFFQAISKNLQRAFGGARISILPHAAPKVLLPRLNSQALLGGGKQSSSYATMGGTLTLESLIPTSPHDEQQNAGKQALPERPLTDYQYALNEAVRLTMHMNSLPRREPVLDEALIEVQQRIIDAVATEIEHQHDGPNISDALFERQQRHYETAIQALDTYSRLPPNTGDQRTESARYQYEMACSDILFGLYKAELQQTTGVRVDDPSSISRSDVISLHDVPETTHHRP